MGWAWGAHVLLRGSRLQEMAIRSQGEYRDWQGKGLVVPGNHLMELSLLASRLTSLHISTEEESEARRD